MCTGVSKGAPSVKQHLKRHRLTSVISVNLKQHFSPVEFFLTLLAIYVLYTRDDRSIGNLVAFYIELS